ncbi:MAG: fructosamine kinase family protein [Myxococcota bacterium]
MDLAAEIEGLLGIRVEQLGGVSGGDVAQAYRADLANGARVFAKTRAGAAPDFFETEARGLAWLHEAEALPVPEVLAVSTAPPLLVLEWIEVGAPQPRGEAAFGRALAELHRAGAPCFGREDRRTTGSRGLPNEPCARWSEFFASQRLLPLARLAKDGDALPGRAIRALEALAGRLDTLGVPDEPPARLHGDLWGGNRLIDTAGHSWLIDPAAHGGHREFDLAMMRLFGGFGEAAHRAYDEVAPLAPGSRERVSLHQLAPLTVHAIKFGGGYVGATEQALADWV